MTLSDNDLELLNSDLGQKFLYSTDRTSPVRALRQTKAELRLRSLQEELIKLQDWVIRENKKVVILFEGRDSAGKGGAIRRFSSRINPRFYQIVALPKPTSVERNQWYFQRYVNRLPKPGEIVFFDRSWYNRAVVEPVNGFCTQEEYRTFMRHINAFERMITDSDTYLIKLYFSITKEEQARRFREIKMSPLKRWKMTAVDEKAQELWDEYTKYKVRVLKKTNTKNAPWTIIKANRKTLARTTAIEHVLQTIPYT
ncbi:MAG: polyphosphate kinase 2 [Spirosomaceae bacterium]|nr:polyphosphate kinase 2 [Spirosomataceae bacterium]